MRLDQLLPIGRMLEGEIVVRQAMGTKTTDSTLRVKVAGEPRKGVINCTY